MIQETIYFEVVCDKCGERLELDGITAWDAAEDAEDAANYAEWTTYEDNKGTRVLCDTCADTGIDYDEREGYDE